MNKYTSITRSISPSISIETRGPSPTVNQPQGGYRAHKPLHPSAAGGRPPKAETAPSLLPLPRAAATLPLPSPFGGASTFSGKVNTQT